MNIKKTVIILMCISLIFMFISNIMFFDLEHMLEIHNEHCAPCALFYSAKKLISILVIVIIMVILKIIETCSIYSNDCKNEYSLQTLISSKVRLNE